MKKAWLVSLLLVMMAAPGVFAAKTTTRTVAAAAPAKSVDPVPASLEMIAAPAEQLAEMKHGLAYNFLMDVKMFNMSNPDFLTETSDWFFYTTYRAVVSNVFNDSLGILADVEKPGYASPTYPSLKVNELFAKYKSGNFQMRVGRQIMGDTEDLLLGFQNDALNFGWALGTVDLDFFLAKLNGIMPWGGTMDGMLGFVPTFALNDSMRLKGYLLISTQSAVVNAKSAVNSLIDLGGRFGMGMRLGGSSRLDLNGQLGIQFGMARSATDQSYDATSLGLKLDGGYASQSGDMGFKVKAHLVFTGGSDATTTTPKFGFVSPNSLIGSGPGMFAKIKDGAGPFTYLDALGTVGNKINNYIGVFAFGATGQLEFSDWEVGLGPWIYSNTDKDGKALGTEIDEWVGYHLSKNIKLYQQLAFFIPNTDGVPSGTSIHNPMKFLLGSSLEF